MSSRLLLLMRRRGGFVGPLDSYSTDLAAAYSLRRLLTSYEGSAIRVREDSGNTEADIGFDADGNLDTAALSAHCGANSGYVTAWYDQSGNSKNATNNVAGEQPRIVSSGTIDTINSLPSIRPDNTDDILLVTSPSTPSFITPVASVVVVTDLNESTVSDRLINASTITSYLGVTSSSVSYRTSAFDAHSFPAASTAIAHVVSVMATGASDPRDVNAYRDGVASSDNPNSLNVMTVIWQIFGRTGGSAPYGGKTSELLLWNTDQSSNRASIETNIASYYGITLP